MRIVLAHTIVIFRIVLAHKSVIIRIVLCNQNCRLLHRNKGDWEDSVG
jgi:hypothetical protein